MKTILENIKLICAVVAGVVAVVAIGWKGYAYLAETYVEDERFNQQCVAWKAELDLVKEEITGVRNDFLLQKYQTRLWQLEQWIRELDMAFGQNCERCDQRDRSMYWEMRKEHQWLKQEVQRIMRYGG